MTIDTYWRQYEPRAREDSMTEGVRAEIHDPLWMLSRQWQLHEFEGEDAGSPIEAEVTVDSDRLARVHLLGDEDDDSNRQEPIDYNEGPLEPFVERESILSGTSGSNRRLAAEAGLHFLRILELRDFPEPAKRLTAADFPERLRLRAPDTELDAPTRRFFEVMAGALDDDRGHGRVLDGRAVYDAIEAAVDDVEAMSTGGAWSVTDSSALPLPNDGDVTDTYRQAIAEYTHWYRSLYTEPTAASGSAWVPDRMEYRFRASTGADEEETVFEAREYEGGRLDWHDFSVVPGASLGDRDEPDSEPSRELSTTETVRTVPTQVKYPGMPSTRWWELEDSGVSLDDIVADGDGLPQLVLIEFAGAFGNDWFQFPLETEVGTLNRITSLRVTDTFGVSESATSVRDFDEGWNAFGFELPDTTGLFLPPTLSATLDGDPVERVRLGRDELANMAFGIEELVEGPVGLPVDRTEFRRPRLAVSSVRPDAAPDVEFVEFVNSGDDRLDITGYTVGRERSDGAEESIHTFGEVKLGPRKTVRLHTGLAGDPDAHSAGRSVSAWADAATDSLVVRDAEGTVAAKRSFGGPDSRYADYRLATDVPDYWFPFTMDPASDGTENDAALNDYRLVRSVLLDASTLGLDAEHLPRPMGRVLVPSDRPDLRLYEEELPGSGREIERRYQYTRWTDGSAHLWAGRRARSGRGDISSRLRFDVLEESG